MRKIKPNPLMTGARIAELILPTAAGFVLLSVILVIFIDLRNVLGLGDILNRHFFWHWYRNGGPVEMLQWLLLAASALTSLFVVGRLSTRDRSACAFWLLMGIAFTLMLIEDAGDPRHRIREYVQFAFAEHEGQGVMGTLWELLYFVGLAAFPLYALLRHGRALRGMGRTRSYVLAGFVAYGIAASFSFVGSAFSALMDRNVYQITGDALVRLGLRIGDSELPRYWTADGYVDFHLMDGMVEESIELIGAAAFFSAAVSFLSVGLEKDPAAPTGRSQAQHPERETGLSAPPPRSPVA